MVHHEEHEGPEEGVWVSFPIGTLGTPYATRMQRTGIGQRIDV